MENIASPAHPQIERKAGFNPLVFLRVLRPMFVTQFERLYHLNQPEVVNGIENLHKVAEIVRNKPETLVLFTANHFARRDPQVVGVIYYRHLYDSMKKDIIIPANHDDTDLPRGLKSLVTGCAEMLINSWKLKDLTEPKKKIAKGLGNIGMVTFYNTMSLFIGYTKFRIMQGQKVGTVHTKEEADINHGEFYSLPEKYPGAPIIIFVDGKIVYESEINEGKKRIYRSKLSKGKSGAAAIALKHDALIVPIGINYPEGHNPFSLTTPPTQVNIGEPYFMNDAVLPASRLDETENIREGRKVIMQSIARLLRVETRGFWGK